jgi:hypothetical protein
VIPRLLDGGFEPIPHRLDLAPEVIADLPDFTAEVIADLPDFAAEVIADLPDFTAEFITDLPDFAAQFDPQRREFTVHLLAELHNLRFERLDPGRQSFERGHALFEPFYPCCKRLRRHRHLLRCVGHPETREDLLRTQSEGRAAGRRR